MSKRFMILVALLWLAPTISIGEVIDVMSDAERLNALIEEDWEWRLREYPTFATYTGDRRYGDRLTDMSAPAIERRKAYAREMLKKLEAIDRPALPERSRLDYDLFHRDFAMEVEGQKYPGELMPINQMGGVHQDLAELAILAPKAKAEDLRNLIVRMRAYPKLVDETIALMRLGLERGVIPASVPLRGTAEAIAAQIAEAPERSPIWGIAFADLADSIPQSAAVEIRRDAAAALRDEVFPALRKLQRFWNEEYYPKTRETVGLSALPNGRAWYDYNIRASTTTDMTADQIHAIGLSEVKRIREQMETIKGEVGFEGDLQVFFRHLRTDPKFFFDSEEMLLMTYRDISKRIDPELPRLFGTLPRMPYGVIPVPDYSEKTQTTAYYMPGSPAAGRPGYFYANTYDLPSRPKWEMEALTVHEAVPGHHLQISLAQELEDVPNFRRWGGYTAFVEGWGLYSESLGPELGLYQDPYSRFGQLTYEMWRAVRLVVDTGMHAKGWTRQQAIDYFSENAGKAEHDIVIEVDRYIVWPGQALAYKIGQMKIQELRARAEKKLGERFDIRQFHDTVLLAGPLPLAILEARVNDWIAAR